MKATVAVTTLLIALLLAGDSSCAQNKSGGGTTSGAKTMKRGWIGVSVMDVTPRLAREDDLKVTSGVLIREVAEESPAEKAGLKEDDIIVEFNGKKIELSDDLVDAVRSTAPETKAAVRVLRGGEKKTITVTVGKEPKRHMAYSFTTPHIPPLPHIQSFHVFAPHSMLGLTLHPLNSQLAEYFDVPERKGVLVENVESESASEKAGFKAGDVIVKVGNEAVESPEDIAGALEETKKGDKVEFSIVRKGAQKTLTVEAGDLTPWHSHEFRSHKDLERRLFQGFDSKEFNHDMEKLKEELRSVGARIKIEVRHIRDTLRAAFI